MITTLTTRAFNRSRPPALRHALAAVPLACAALLAAPPARAATAIVNVPCGTPIDVSGNDVKVVLQNCTYPSMYVSLFPGSVEGNGAVIDMMQVPNAIAFATGNEVALRDLRFTGGVSYGGLQLRVQNATLERVVISGNRSPGGGGGLHSQPDVLRSLTLADSTIADNSAQSGGGMWVDTDSSRNVTLRIVRSTISGNRATFTGGGLWISSNGGQNTLQLANSTLSGNVADVHGGALWLEGYFNAKIDDSTITGNRAGMSADAISDNAGGVPEPGLQVRRSIIAGNGLDSVADCNSDFKQDYGHNVLVAECVRDVAPEPTTKVIASNGALLGALADNGGRTKTHLPMAGSPALDMIASGSTGCSSGATDQRGIARPQNGACDAGAVEVATVAMFPWSGFVGPINNPPMVNSMKAGAVAPVKFGLGGDRGLAIFAMGYPKSQFTACSGGAVDAVEETMTPGSSGMHYDVVSDTYTYAWKTDKAWAGRCATLLLRFVDGAERQALFQFK